MDPLKVVYTGKEPGELLMGSTSLHVEYGTVVALGLEYTARRKMFDGERLAMGGCWVTLDEWLASDAGRAHQTRLDAEAGKGFAAKARKMFTGKAPSGKPVTAEVK